MSREITPEALQLLKNLEGCRLTVYSDLVGLSTVGYGHRTTLPVGTHVSQESVDELLDIDVGMFAKDVERLVHVPLNDNQFSALVLFAFNVGSGRLEHSTLLKLLNQGDYQGAADQFLAWDMAGGHVVGGLRDRREAERNLFLKASNG